MVISDLTPIFVSESRVHQVPVGAQVAFFTCMKSMLGLSSFYLNSRSGCLASACTADETGLLNLENGSFDTELHGAKDIILGVCRHPKKQTFSNGIRNKKSTILTLNRQKKKTTDEIFPYYFLDWRCILVARAFTIFGSVYTLSIEKSAWGMIVLVLVSLYAGHAKKTLQQTVMAWSIWPFDEK